MMFMAGNLAGIGIVGIRRHRRGCTGWEKTRKTAPMAERLNGFGPGFSCHTLGGLGVFVAAFVVYAAIFDAERRWLARRARAA